MNLNEFEKNIDNFTKLHNQRFNKKQYTESVFTSITKSDIKDNLNLWMYRKVTNGNTISINSEHYIPVKKGKRILFDDGAKIKILSN